MSSSSSIWMCLQIDRSVHLENSTYPLRWAGRAAARCIGFRDSATGVCGSLLEVVACNAAQSGSGVNEGLVKLDTYASRTVESPTSMANAGPNPGTEGGCTFREEGTVVV